MAGNTIFLGRYSLTDSSKLHEHSIWCISTMYLLTIGIPLMIINGIRKGGQVMLCQVMIWFKYYTMIWFNYYVGYDLSNDMIWIMWFYDLSRNCLCGIWFKYYIIILFLFPQYSKKLWAYIYSYSLGCIATKWPIHILIW